MSFFTRSSSPVHYGGYDSGLLDFLKQLGYDADYFKDGSTGTQGILDNLQR